MINMENIQELKSQISLLEVQLKSSKQDVEMLKFELKAADSVNENLSKQVDMCKETLLYARIVIDRNAFPKSYDMVTDTLMNLTNQNKQ